MFCILHFATNQDCGACRHAEVMEVLRCIDQKFNRIERKLNAMAQTFDEALNDLTAAAAEETTVDQSIITLLNDIADKLDKAQGDPAKVAVVTALMRNNSAAIVAAVKARTPIDVPPANPDVPPNSDLPPSGPTA